MSRDLVSLPPFPAGYRASGLLLHVTSLPSPYGIGDVGPAALSWIDRLHDAGQSWWQALPLGPTGYGNSPYQSLSSFAANRLLISPDWLIEDELLGTRDVQVRSFPQTEIDYNAVIAFKHGLLEKAWANFNAGARADLRPACDQFRHEQAHWLEDYALFRALKAKFSDSYYLEWPAELVRREPEALNRVRHELADQIGEVCFAQFLLFRQGERLKAHARRKGLGLIGDLPFFVSPDSSDVWGHPELFLLDEQRRPRFVAGVPPDYFSAQGQLWGNPVYDWDALRQSGYRWCISRLRSLLAHVDVIRLDHFRAFAAAWHVPAGAPTAQSGKWVPGPHADFFQPVQRELGALPFIVEDLGVITPDVYALRDQFHLPGTRVLQFAFDGHSDNPYLPDNYVTNAAVYTGTHDNPTTRGWFEELPDYQRKNLWQYVKRPGGESGEAAPALMGLAWSSVAAVSMAPLQDLLNLGKEARMNVPGRAEGNWRWRCTEDMLSDRPFKWLSDLTKNSNRSGAVLSTHGETTLEVVSPT
jgi:4-alpha-glucanotransferase